MPIKELTSIGVLAAAMFFRMVGVFAALPVAAILAAQLHGGTAGWAVGLAVGGYGITQALLQIPAGMWADRLGRKPVMIVMLLIFAAGGFVAAAADTVWQLAAGRLLQGGGAVAAVAAAWIADVTAPARRAKAMLVYGLAIVLAFVTSLFLAPPLAGWLGLAEIFALAGWLGVLSAVAVALLPAPPRAQTGGAATVINRPIMACAGGAFVAHYALSALFLQLPPLLLGHLALAEQWRFYVPSFLLSLALSLPLLWWRNSRLAMLVAMLLLAAGIALMLLGDGGVWQLGAGILLFFGGFVVLEATIPARASRAVAADKRGAALGVVMSMGFLGVFCGAAVSGALLDFIGIRGVFFALMLLLAGGFVIIAKEG